MEALLEREEEQVENWNDDRLDELSQTMKDGFAQIHQKLDQIPRREEIDQRFAATDRRIDRLNLRLEHMVWAIVAAAGGLIGNLLSDKI